MDNVDVGNLAYVIMFWEGLGNLFPWNAFITAAAYFATRFCGTAFESDFENFFSIAFMLSQTAGLALAVKYQNVVSLETRIISPLTLYCIVFIFTTIFVVVDMNSNSLFYITLLSACICGLCGSILSGGLFGLAGVFPPAYTGALMNGQGLGGLFVSIASILTIVSLDPVDTCGDDATDDSTCDFSIDYSALAYFIIACLVLISCAVVFMILHELPFTKYYMARAGFLHKKDALNSNSLLMDNGKDGFSSDVSPLHDEMDGEGVRSVSKSAERAMSSNHADSHQSDISFSTIKRVLKIIMVPAMSVTFIFTVTIGLFPSIIVLIESTEKCNSSERFYNDLWTPFFFLLFNLFDFAGRVLAGMIQPIFTAENIWIASFSRVIFFPLIMLCKLSDSQLPTVFTNDAWPILFMVLFSLSNGYVASLSMMFGPSLVEPQDSMLAGTIMVFCLTIGLFFGACTSFLALYIVTGEV